MSLKTNVSEFGDQPPYVTNATAPMRVTLHNLDIASTLNDLESVANT